MAKHIYALKFLIFNLLLLLTTGNVVAQPGFSGNYAMRYVVEGDNLMKIGDFNGAILSYTTAINSNIGFGEAYVKRSIALKLVGRFAEGKDDLDKAMRLGPQYMTMYDTLTTKKMRTDSLATLSNPYENIDFSKIPDDTTTYITSALASMDVANYKGSVKFLKDYLKKFPNDTLALVYSALAYTNAEQYDTALIFIKRITAVKSRFAVPYNIYGLYYYKQGYYLEAIDNFNKALQINPNMAVAYFNRAMCKKKLGNDRGYDDDFEKAVDVDQQVANVYYNRSFYERTAGGDMESARDDYGKAGENDKLYKHPYYESGPGKKLLTDYYNLYTDFSNLIDKNPADPDALYDRANFLMLFGDYTPAVIDFNKAVNMAPQNADYLFNRGIARIIKTDNNMGCRDIKKSADLGADNAKIILDQFCK